jgi:hypothetical protein
MDTRKVKLVIGAICVSALCACASATPQTDSRFGHAVNQAKMQQTLDPDAGSKARSVDGLGGTPARESIERYHDTFKAPPPTFEVIFGTGTSGGGR